MYRMFAALLVVLVLAPVAVSAQDKTTPFKSDVPSCTPTPTPPPPLSIKVWVATERGQRLSSNAHPFVYVVLFQKVDGVYQYFNGTDSTTGQGYIIDGEGRFDFSYDGKSLTEGWYLGQMGAVEGEGDSVEFYVGPTGDGKNITNLSLTLKRQPVLSMFRSGAYRGKLDYVVDALKETPDDITGLQMYTIIQAPASNGQWSVFETNRVDVDLKQFRTRQDFTADLGSIPSGVHVYGTVYLVPKGQNTRPLAITWFQALHER